jgi:hypothetical protein
VTYIDRHLAPSARDRTHTARVAVPAEVPKRFAKAPEAPPREVTLAVATLGPSRSFASHPTKDATVNLDVSQALFAETLAQCAHVALVPGMVRLKGIEMDTVV